MPATDSEYITNIILLVMYSIIAIASASCMIKGKALEKETKKVFSYSTVLFPAGVDGIARHLGFIPYPCQRWTFMAASMILILFAIKVGIKAPRFEDKWHRIDYVVSCLFGIILAVVNITTAVLM